MSSELMLDKSIKDAVDKVWESVFKTSNKVLADYHKYGFSGMAIVPDPNIHQMLFSIQVVNLFIDLLINSADNIGIEYDEIRKLINSKQQFALLEELASALKANDRGGFDTAMEKLRVQCVF